MNAKRQHGSALMIALFLVVVVGALGVVAIRIGGVQQQTATLQLLGFQAEAAANAGVEAWAYAISTVAPPCPAVALPGQVINIGSYPNTGLNGFTVRVDSCTRTPSGTGWVYDIVVSAQRGTFGQPDFARRVVSQRMSNIGTGSYR